MPYPREIYLDTDTEERLISYVEDELSNHYGERGNHIEDLMRWQKDYWAKPQSEKATYPYQGAATIIIPLSAIAIETIHARNMTTRFGFPQLVSATALASEWEGAERTVERFVDRELTTVMKIRKPMGDCYLEAEKFGTMIGKSGYERTVKSAVRLVGDVEEAFDVTVKDGATFDAVADARFLMPNSASDPQTAPWCGEEHTATPYEILMLERGGLFRPGTIEDDTFADKTEPLETRKGIAAWVHRGQLGALGVEGGAKFDANQNRLDNTTPVWPSSIDWVEIWLAFDIDQSGVPKEIVLHYHRPSKTIMSLRYNWHSDLRRPYRTNVYFPVEHRWRGIGICKMNEQFQKEITTQHRQRIDNATIANTKMLKISKLSGYGPREPIFPGKQWFLDSMDQLDVVSLGEINSSAFANEQASVLYSQQRTGVNETTLGMPQQGTPGTATSDLARIQEGNRKFDFSYQNFTEFSNEVIMDIVANIHQFGPRHVEYFDKTDGGQMVRKFFDMPVGDIRDGLLIQLRTTAQHQNKILERQNWIQLAPLMQQYYLALLQLAQPMGNPQLMEVITKKGLWAATEAMRQILEAYDVRNVDRIVVKELEELLNAGSTGAGPQLGAAPGSAGAGANAPMDIIAAAMRSIGENGNGAANRIQQSV
jgi:hypothetical protein